MSGSIVHPQRQTSADIIFERLYDQIISLALLPGTKISEADVAERFGVSRQPVRDAFNRLGNMGFLLIQPQRATVVQKFSLDSISEARFVRQAIELELVRTAIDNWTETSIALFEPNLELQVKAVKNSDAKAFHALDEAFHKLIADIAAKPFAFDIVKEQKAKIDRICVLSLKDAHGMQELVNDHQQLVECLSKNDKVGAERCLRIHLSRISKTIEIVQARHSDYFTV